MDVEFKDLTYTVPGPGWVLKGPDKVLLHSVSGLFKPGELSAIMGPSGAGKSSLLNALSGYRSTGVSGTMMTNGKQRDERVFRSRSCYITQTDLLQPLLTLRELMMFAAKLKLPADSTEKQRWHTVSVIIKQMGLTATEKTLTENLSGGQKKRLSVALELINNPPVFFLDEPTSGLDNVSSKLCLKMLRSLAKQGRTIVCTIHQPSALLFKLFDHVYVLSQGLCVYQGTTTGVVSYLESVGLNCPLSYNPADYVIEVTDGEDSKNVPLLSAAIGNGNIIWKESSISDKNTNTDTEDFNPDLVKHDMSMFSLKSADGDLDVSLGFAASPWVQFSTLAKRMLLQTVRNKTAVQLQLFHHVACGLMVSLLFSDTADDADKWFLTLKCVIGIIIFHAYTWCIVPILTYPNEVKLMKKEYFNRWYGFSAYYIALTLTTIPAKIILSTIFLTIVYYTMGIPFGIERFSVFCCTGIITSMVSESLGYAVGATFNITNGSAVGPACLAPFLGLAVYGFDFAKQIPFVTRILMQLSFIRSGVVILIMATFGFNRGKLRCTDQFNYCYFEEPEMLLDMLDLQYSVYLELLGLSGLLIVFKVLFFFALWKRLKK